MIVELVAPDQAIVDRCLLRRRLFRQSLLDKFDRVIGIDWDRFAIEAAKKNATLKENYIAGEVDAELPRIQIDHKQTTLLVDPPATGLSPTVRRTIRDLAPPTLIYISCNPSTLARDLKELQEQFVIQSVTPLDMFPQTAEIEIAVQMRAA